MTDAKPAEPIWFPYEITQVRRNVVCLEIDRAVAEALGVRARRYFIGGSDAWGEAVRAVQDVREAATAAAMRALVSDLAGKGEAK